MELKDWLNSINFTKEDITQDDPSVIKDYAPYIVTICDKCDKKAAYIY